MTVNIDNLKIIETIIRMRICIFINSQDLHSRICFGFSLFRSRVGGGPFDDTRERGREIV